MARELVPKICEIPADALPFLLMGVLVMWIQGWPAGRGGFHSMHPWEFGASEAMARSLKYATFDWSGKNS